MASASEAAEVLAGSPAGILATATPDRLWWRDRLLWVVMVLVTAPLMVVAAMVAGRTWLPASDWALIELRTREVGTANTPLVGPFSRYGWNHPGPTMFWLLAPAYRFGGQAASSLMVGAALLNATMIAASIAIARRVGGRSLLVLWGAATAAFIHAAADMLIDPWNPYLSLAPFAVFMLASWGLATGVWWLAPVVVATGSFTIHNHVGYVLVVSVVMVWVVVAAAGAFRQQWSSQRRSLIGPLVASLAVASGMWLAPVVQQVTDEPANMSGIVSYFTRDGNEPAAGWGAAGDVVGRSLAPFGPWLGFGEPTDPDTLQVGPTPAAWALPLIVLLLATGIAAARRRDRIGVVAAATVGVAMVAGTVAVSRISGVAYFYIVRWWWVVGMLAWVVVVWLAWRLVADRANATTRTVALTCALVAMAGFGTATIAGAGTLPNPGPPVESNAVAATTDDVVAALSPSNGLKPDSSGPYRLVPRGPSLNETFFGLVNQLDKRGVAVVVDPEFQPHVGAHRVVGQPDAAAPSAGTVVVVSGGSTRGFDTDADWELVAVHDPLTPAQRRELDGLQERVAAELSARGRTADADVAREFEVIGLVRNDPLGLTPQEVASLTLLAFSGKRQWVFVSPTASAPPP